MNARKFKAGQLLCWNTGVCGVGAGNSYRVVGHGSLSPIFEQFRDRNEDDVMLCLGRHNETYVLCLLGDQKLAVEWFVLEELK